jgi:hypothetical protein
MMGSRDGCSFFCDALRDNFGGFCEFGVSALPLRDLEPSCDKAGD